VSIGGGNILIKLVWKAKKLPQNDPMAVSVSPDGTLYAISSYPPYLDTNLDRSLIYVSEDRGDSWGIIDMKSAPIENSTGYHDRIEVYHVVPTGPGRLIAIAEISVPGPLSVLFSDDGGADVEQNQQFLCGR